MRLSPIALPLACLLACCATRAGAAVARVSLTDGGAQADDASVLEGISDDGRYALFASVATNLAPSVRYGLYLRDRWSRRTRLLVAMPALSRSRSVDGTLAVLSGDGTTVAYTRQPYDHVRVLDVASGVEDIVDAAPGGALANDAPSWLAIDDSGRFIAWFSGATNLVPGPVASSPFPIPHDVFWCDRATRTVRCLSAPGGLLHTGYGSAVGISDSGRWVAYDSISTALVPGSGDHRGVYLANAFTRSLTRVDLAWDGGAADGDSLSVAISGNGRFVAFGSEATNLVEDDGNGVADVFVYDRFAPFWSPRLTRLALPDTPRGVTSFQLLSMSDDGRFVAFGSDAFPLAGGAGTGRSGVFVHDRLTGVLRRLSVALDGGEPDGFSAMPFVSGNGRFVGWTSAASDLIRGDTNGSFDAFVAPTGLLPLLPLPPWWPWAFAGGPGRFPFANG